MSNDVGRLVAGYVDEHSNVRLNAATFYTRPKEMLSEGLAQILTIRRGSRLDMPGGMSYSISLPAYYE